MMRSEGSFLDVLSHQIQIVRSNLSNYLYGYGECGRFSAAQTNTWAAMTLRTSRIAPPSTNSGLIFTP
jgi:hypothetical protein